MMDNGIDTLNTPDKNEDNGISGKVKKQKSIIKYSWAAKKSHQYLEWFTRSQRADLNYWARHRTWSLDETTALFFKRNPDNFDWKKAETQGEKYRRVQDCKLMRRVAADDIFLGRDRVSTRDILIWAEAQSLFFPRTLLQAVERAEIHRLEKDDQNTYWNGMETKERNSVFRLLLALIIEHHGLDPTAQNLRGLKRIVEVTGKLNYNKETPLLLSYNTVVKIIREAAEQLDLDGDGVKAALKERGLRKNS